MRDVAAWDGRYHRAGDPQPLYASSTREAAWLEFLRKSPAELPEELLD